MARYCVYADGFNMYHALDDRYPWFKWINYAALAGEVVGPNDLLENVVYFTAFASWKNRATVERHKLFIRVLRSADVEVVRGRFMRKHIRRHRCQRRFLTHEEKRTDVNIAVRIVADAVEDRFDRAVIVSADSDLLPVIDTVHALTPDKEIGIMFPVGRTSEDLKRHADFRRKMPEKLLARCQFPAIVTVGESRIARPAEWPQPPSK